MRSLILLAAAFLGFTFLGAISRPADAIALLRPIFTAIAFFGVFAFAHWAAKALIAALVLASLMTLVPPFLGQQAGADMRLYSKNLLPSNTQITALADDILDADVDAVLLQEVSVQNDDILELLRPRFPHQHHCRFSNWSGIAIASKHPLTNPGKCTDARAMAAAEIDLNGRPVWLVSTHIHWPWPAPSEKAEADAHALLAELDGTIVIAGDFNTLPWTHRLHKIRALSGTKLAGPVRASFHLRALPLPIDFALSPGGGRVEMREKIGSDHAGLLASLSLSEHAQ